MGAPSSGRMLDAKEMAMQMLAFLTSFPAGRGRRPDHDGPVAAATAAARLMLALAMIGVVVVGLQIASEVHESDALRRIAASSERQGARP
jgi:hypothetical protein